MSGVMAGAYLRGMQNLSGVSLIRVLPTAIRRRSMGASPTVTKCEAIVQGGG